MHTQATSAKAPAAFMQDRDVAFPMNMDCSLTLIQHNGRRLIPPSSFWLSCGTFPFRVADLSISPADFQENCRGIMLNGSTTERCDHGVLTLGVLQPYTRKPMITNKF